MVTEAEEKAVIEEEEVEENSKPMTNQHKSKQLKLKNDRFHPIKLN